MVGGDEERVEVSDGDDMTCVVGRAGSGASFFSLSNARLNLPFSPPDLAIFSVGCGWDAAAVGVWESGDGRGDGATAVVFVALAIGPATSGFAAGFETLAMAAGDGPCEALAEAAGGGEAPFCWLALLSLENESRLASPILGGGTMELADPLLAVLRCWKGALGGSGIAAGEETDRASGFARVSKLGWEEERGRFSREGRWVGPRLYG